MKEYLCDRISSLSALNRIHLLPSQKPKGKNGRAHARPHRGIGSPIERVGVDLSWKSTGLARVPPWRCPKSWHFEIGSQKHSKSTT